MPRQIFKDKIIAAAGPLPGQFTVDNLKRWTKLRKGQFTDAFDESVTHLLCTREQFNKRVPRIKEALKRGKKCHILHCDWFDYSTFYEKRQPEKEYSMRNILAKRNAVKRERARVERGIRNGEKFVNTNYYHIYQDRELFPYEINITRNDESTGEEGQRYTLCLWESNAKPHLYWFTVKFMKRKGDSQPTYHRPTACSGKWRAQMDLFMDFFRIKTGIEWQDRVLKQKVMPVEYFQYQPPTGGKPIGRRLRFAYDYCLEVNAQMRGLPWPPVEETVVALTPGAPDDMVLSEAPVHEEYDEADGQPPVDIGDENADVTDEEGGNSMAASTPDTSFASEGQDETLEGKAGKSKETVDYVA